jgi:hypothetical protein
VNLCFLFRFYQPALTRGCSGMLDAGIHFLKPFVDEVTFVRCMKSGLLDCPPQHVVSQDNVSLAGESLRSRAECWFYYVAAGHLTFAATSRWRYHHPDCRYVQEVHACDVIASPTPATAHATCPAATA